MSMPQIRRGYRLAQLRAPPLRGVVSNPYCMINSEDHGGRIEAHGGGTGEISNPMIRKRAKEIAVQEGRDTVREDDLVRARRELIGGPAPEGSDDSAIDDVAESIPPDEPAGSSGYMHERFSSLEEESAAERLVQEGLDEAEHERMTEAEKGERRRAK